MAKFKFILFAAFLLVFSSCNFYWDSGKTGNGHVVSEERSLDKSFEGIHVSAGLHVFLLQGDQEGVRVEADENLLELISTEVENGILVIKPTSPIRRAKSKNIYVTYRSINRVRASSGSYIQTNNTLKNREVSVKASSGARVLMDIFSEDADVSSSSGSEVELSGKTISLTSSVSSGGMVKAQGLQSLRCITNASSGGSAYLNVKEELNAKASSGGKIVYYGEPSVLSEKSSSGTVKKG